MMVGLRLECWIAATAEEGEPAFILLFGGVLLVAVPLSLPLPLVLAALPQSSRKNLR